MTKIVYRPKTAGNCPSYVKKMNPTDEEIVSLKPLEEYVENDSFSYIREYGSIADTYEIVSEKGKGFVLKNSSDQYSFHENLNGFDKIEI